MSAWLRGRRVVVLAVLLLAAAASLILVAIARRRGDPTAEARAVVGEIQRAQEAYRAEYGTYANVSTALGTSHANHHALYPAWPHEPPARKTPWSAPCPKTACNGGVGWRDLPVHVDGPVAFGYSTIAGRAGERPTSVVSIDGRPMAWPVPEKDWYIVTAVGDPSHSGRPITVVAASFGPELLVDRGER